MESLVFSFTFYFIPRFRKDRWYRNFLDNTLGINCYEKWISRRVNLVSRPVEHGFPWREASVTQTHLDKEVRVWRV